MAQAILDRLGSHREMLDSERNLAQAIGTTPDCVMVYAAPVAAIVTS